jgi:putative FmdB family regulatory protein
MPTYEYACTACGKKFALTMTFANHDRARPKCPKCGSGKVRQRFSAFSAKTAKKS